MTLLARFRESKYLTRMYGCFDVDDDDTECCRCDRLMEIGEVGYGGQYDGFSGDCNDHYCRRCAFARMRDYNGKYDAEWCRRSCGAYRYSRAFDKQARRQHPTRPRYFAAKARCTS